MDLLHSILMKKDGSRIEAEDSGGMRRKYLVRLQQTNIDIRVGKMTRETEQLQPKKVSAAPTDRRRTLHSAQLYMPTPSVCVYAVRETRSTFTLIRLLTRS